MSKLELTAEELKLITDLREQKAAEEAEAKKKVSLEKQFEAEVEAVQKKINVHIENARRELKKAVEISEETGIPFSSGVVDLGYKQRGYIPWSFEEKWRDEELMEKLDMYGGYCGFQAWNVSGLNC